MVGLPLWVVIITVCEAVRMLSSSVDNLSARRYNSSMVVGGSRDKDWKNGWSVQSFFVSFAGPHPYCKYQSARQLIRTCM